MTESTELPSNAEVVIVDDVKSARKVLGRLLAKLGVTTVLECENGQSALQTIQAHPQVALVISDRMMPDINGIELLRQLRASDTTKLLPFILISSSCDENDARSVASAAKAEILLKPFTSASLARKIAGLVGPGSAS